MIVVDTSVLVEFFRAGSHRRSRRYVRSSSIDCFIAQLVLEVDGTLLHADEDFERIKAVRPLRTFRGEAARE